MSKRLNALLALCLLLVACSGKEDAEKPADTVATADRAEAQAEPVVSSSEYDILIRNGLVYDGTGAEPVAADVAIRGDRIVAIGPGLELSLIHI